MKRPFEDDFREIDGNKEWPINYTKYSKSQDEYIDHLESKMAQIAEMTDKNVLMLSIRELQDYWNKINKLTKVEE